MRKIFSFYLLFCLVYLFLGPACFAYDKSKITMTAEKPDPLNLAGEIDKRVLKKYIPVKINIDNRDVNEVHIPNTIYYRIEDKEYKTPGASLVFNKTKRHTARRAVIWGIGVSVVTFFIFTPFAVAGSIAHSVSANGVLEDNIKKNSHRSHNLYETDLYSAYIFIPKRHKKADEVIIKGAKFNNDEAFDLKATISD